MLGRLDPGRIGEEHRRKTGLDFFQRGLVVALFQDADRIDLFGIVGG